MMSESGFVFDTVATSPSPYLLCSMFHRTVPARHSKLKKFGTTDDRGISTARAAGVVFYFLFPPSHYICCYEKRVGQTLLSLIRFIENASNICISK
jgi:hypothetical protein